MKIAENCNIFPLPILRARGICLLGFLLLVPLAGLVLSIPFPQQFILVLSAVTLALVSICLDFLKVVSILRGLECTSEAETPLLSGVPLSIRFALRVTELREEIAVRLRPIFPEHFSVEREIEDFSLNETTSSETVVYNAIPLSRGEVVWSTVYLRLSRAHEIICWQVEILVQDPTTYLVMPNASGIIGAREPVFKRQQSGERLVDARDVHGREFDSLRPYAHGDNLRQVDWKRSSRGRGVMVKIYRPETHQRLNIAIDCSRRMGNLVDSRLQIEFAADAASHLVRLANRCSDQVGLFAFNHRVVSQLACKSGLRQERLIRTKLTELSLSTFDADFQLLAEWSHLNKKRSLLLLITSISNGEGLDSIRAALAPVRRKHLPLVFAVADRSLEELAYSKAANLGEAYQVAAAVEQLQEIRARAAQLQREGIECFYCDVRDLGVMMREKYYSMKASGRL